MLDQDHLIDQPGHDPASAGADNACWMVLFSAWLVALTATLASLFIGEVMGRVPCILCWYQRIAMFPLPIILGLGLLLVDLRSVRYAMPFAVGGWAVALYHCLLYWSVVPEGLVPCGQGASCTQAQLMLVGFLPIPVLSLTAFSLIVVLLITPMRRLRT